MRKDDMLQTLKNRTLRDAGFTDTDVRKYFDRQGCTDCKTAGGHHKHHHQQVPYPSDLGSTWHADPIFFTTPTGKKITALLMVEHASNFAMVEVIQSAQEAQIGMALDKIRTRARKFQIEPKQMYFDNDQVVKRVETWLNMEINFQPSGNHERTVERKVRDLRTRWRTSLSSVPFKLPIFAYEHLVKSIVKHLNLCPNQKTGSDSPLDIVRMNLGLTRLLISGNEAEHAFGDIVLCNDTRDQPTGAHNGHPRTHGIVLETFHESAGRTTILPLPPPNSKAGFTRNGLIQPAVTAKTSTRVQPDENMVKDINNLTRLCDGLPSEQPFDAKGMWQLAQNLEVQITRPTGQRPIQDIIGNDEPLKTKLVASQYNQLRELAGGNVRRTALSLATESRTGPEGDEPRGDDPERDSHHSLQALLAAAKEYVPPQDAANVESARPIALQAIQAVESRHKSRALDPLSEEEEEEARTAEIQTLMNHGTLQRTTRAEITNLEWWKRLYIRLFTTRKREGNAKARAVGGTGGRRQDRNDLLHGPQGGSYSPTVAIPSLFLAIAMASIMRKHHMPQDSDFRGRRADVKSAYLHAEHDREQDAESGEPFRRIIQVRDAEADTMERLNRVHKWWEDGETTREEDGSILFLLEKSLYGLLQSGLKWFETMRGFLENTCGLEQSEEDPCMFYYKPEGRLTMIVALYVDDLLIFSTQEDFDFMRQKMDERFKDGNGVAKNTYDEAESIDYLNMRINHLPDHSITVDQQPYVSLLAEEMGLDHPALRTPLAKTPASLDLFKTYTDGNEATEEEKAYYKSHVQKLAIIAQRTRPDILCTVTFLQSWCKNPSAKHVRALNQLISYVVRTQAKGLRFDPDAEPKIVAYVDASFSGHYDGSSHAGMVLGLGEEVRSLIVCRSGKIPLISDSSTEAEVIAVHKYLQQIVWTENLLSEMASGLGITSEPALICQDNLSALLLHHNGGKPFSKSSHINRRFFKVKEYVNNKMVEMVWKSTLEMLADYQTKTTTGTQLERQTSNYMFSADVT